MKEFGESTSREIVGIQITNNVTSGQTMSHILCVGMIKPSLIL